MSQTAAPTARQSIAKGSQSFYWASLFFPGAIQADCWTLYRWCRYCDDQIDECAPEDAPAALLELEAKTRQALEGHGGDTAFAEMGAICRRHGIPAEHALELLRGFEKDVRNVPYRSISEVETYAYQVAGVVGLMMAKIMGASSYLAEIPAKDLGIAMQLTNIARDVREDLMRGRTYLPSQWLEEAKVDPRMPMLPEQRDQAFAVVQRLLAHADTYYASGLSGLGLLPFRAACAVAIAAEIYSAIGTKILAAGPQALDQRTVVGKGEKVYLTLKGLGRALASRWHSRREALA